MAHGAAVLPRPHWSLWTASLCPIGVLTAASWIGTLNAPALAAANPLLLLALSPRLAFLVAAAGAVPAPAYFVVGIARMAAADPSHYLIGRHGYGFVSRRVARRSPSVHRLLDKVRRVVRSQGLVAVVLRPNGQVLCAAGAAGLRPLPVAVADVLGTTSYLAAVWVAGRWVPDHFLDSSILVTRVFVVTGAGVLVGAGGRRLGQARSARRRADSRRAHPSAAGTGLDRCCFPRVLAGMQ